MNNRIRKPSAPLFGAGKPREESTPGPEPIAESASGRHNLTVRLSDAERERLECIARTEGHPDPLSLAGAVRWLIRSWRKSGGH